MSASVRVYAAQDRHVRTQWEASSVLDLAVSAILSMLSSFNVEVFDRSTNLLSCFTQLASFYYLNLDVNECMTSAHNCNTGMRCENYPGSFRCIREKPCGTGYSVNVYTQECDGSNHTSYLISHKKNNLKLFYIVDIDECSLSLHDCQRGFLCLNVIGTFKLAFYPQ